MLTRYGTNPNGTQKKLASIYTRQEHGISRASIDRAALFVTNRLSSAGFDAFVVGGAVRDLLLGKKPKDFDIVTNAFPRKIKRLFANSRIIGRRFRLVHVRARGKIIEVSTFRANRGSSNNYFGTISEDVRRRDFAINALYYDPREEYIIDYVNGYRDIKEKKIRALIPEERSFTEDPVRMVRAIRYESSTNFKTSGRIIKSIKKNVHGLANCPISRLTEELFKILNSGSSAKFFSRAIDLGLMRYMLPEINGKLLKQIDPVLGERFLSSLRELDRMFVNNETVRKGQMIWLLVRSFIDVDEIEAEQSRLLSREVFLQIKDLLQPLTPPNVEVEKAVSLIVRK